MTRFLTWCRGLFTPRHKRLAQEAINTANDAIASLGHAVATINDATAQLTRLGAELQRTREELYTYRGGCTALLRMAGESVREA